MQSGGARLSRSSVPDCPNPSSGGRTSYIAVDKFLVKRANGPERQALLAQKVK
jgi:hypothetical protein